MISFNKPELRWVPRLSGRRSSKSRMTGNLQLPVGTRRRVWELLSRSVLPRTTERSPERNETSLRGPAEHRYSVSKGSVNADRLDVVVFAFGIAVLC